MRAKSLAAHGIEADKPEECAVPLLRYLNIFDDIGVFPK